MSSPFILIIEYFALASLMTILPFIHIISVIRKKKDVSPLNIDLEYSKTPRYIDENFTKNFHQKYTRESLLKDIVHIDPALGEIKVIHQDLPEKIESKGSLYILDNIRIPAETVVKHMIIAEKSIDLSPKCKAYAIKGAHDITLGENCIINKWIDAKGKIIISENSIIDIACASKSIIMKKGVIFKRVLGHPIQTSEKIKIFNSKNKIDPEKELFHANINQNLLYFFEKNASISEGDTIDTSIVSRHDLKLEKNVCIIGDIKSNSTLDIEEGCVIYGNIFTEKDLNISRNCFIYGNILAHKNIYISKGTQIGTKKYPKSIISHEEISIEEDVILFNYILAVKKGVVI